MADPRCPRCGRHFVQRAHRTGILERLLSVVYIYPFRCQVCMHRFRASRWGQRYRRRSPDRREFERILVRVPVSVTGIAQPASAETTDLSANGCNVTTDALLETGTVVHLELDIQPGAPPATVEAAVVHSAHPGGAGLVFLRIEPAEKDRLRDFLVSLMVRRATERGPGPTAPGR
jgi:hypothetical protein